MGSEDNTVCFNLSVDCEATQPAIQDTGLGERGVRGVAEVLGEQGWRGTFYVIPTDLEASPGMYIDLHQQGHEVGVHVHPAAQGYAEFCGIYDGPTQELILGEATNRFAQVMAFRPTAFCMGYGSCNDATYPVLAKLGYTHGTCSIPGRILPECASVWAGAPLFMHYAHPNNRLLEGDLDFVEIPSTIDWESRMWGGKHPQDLRIELVDAKNHFYTMEKSLRRQIDEQVPVKLIHAITHNTFEYSDPQNFRRRTLEGVIVHAGNTVRDAGLDMKGVTLSDAAAMYRQRVENKTVELARDLRGRLAGTS